MGVTSQRGQVHALRYYRMLPEVSVWTGCFQVLVVLCKGTEGAHTNSQVTKRFIQKQSETKL